MKERHKKWHLTGKEWALLILAGWALLAISAS